jgi:hypothetical protein
MRHAKRTLFLAALIAMVGVSAGAMAAAVASSISPNSGSAASLPGPTLKIATITGTDMETALVIQLRKGATTLVLTKVGDNSQAGPPIVPATELYVTVPSAAIAGVYYLWIDGVQQGALGPPIIGIPYEFKRENNNLQIAVKMTLKARADIQWATQDNAGTPILTGSTAPAGIVGRDDANVAHAEGSFDLFTWIVRDDDLSGPLVVAPPVPPSVSAYYIDIGATYLSSDAANGAKALFIRNVSKTNNTVDLSAIATNTTNWTASVVGPVVATPNTFRLTCTPSLINGGAGAVTAQFLTPAPSKNIVTDLPVSTGVAPFGPTTALASLVLTMQTPAAVTTGNAGTDVETSTVQITATP